MREAPERLCALVDDESRHGLTVTLDEDRGHGSDTLRVRMGQIAQRKSFMRSSWLRPARDGNLGKNGARLAGDPTR